MDHGLALLSVCLPMVLVLVWGKPSSTGFWCNDQSLTYPYKPDTVPQSLLLIVGCGLPFLVMAVLESMLAVVRAPVHRKFPQGLKGFLRSYGLFLLGFAANCIFTDTLKLSVGRLRPHFFDLCRPDFGKINCTDNDSDRFIFDYECTNTLADVKLLKDSQLSFPSGHASVSLYSALFTMCYIQLRKGTTFPSKSSGQLTCLLGQVLSMLLAISCCVTRVADHKHFPSDVLAGGVIGTTVAVLTFYKIAYKVLFEHWKNMPQPLIHLRGDTARSSSVDKLKGL